MFARYCRLAGYETLYVCGTDEYGTATETRALEEGITPRELCDRYHAIHTDIYRWFDISFDHFGRTSVPVHTEITQHIFTKLHENGYITERVLQPALLREGPEVPRRQVRAGHLPPLRLPRRPRRPVRAVREAARSLGADRPRCSVCGPGPVIRETKHLFIDLMTILPKLRNWIESAAEKGFWARNAVQMTYAWMRDGLKERCITRDLKWGIPVPLDGYRDKVFYVWFDAPIGYISITAEHTPEWKSWWYAPKDVKLFQFIGKDNIPFHTVIFPSSLLGTGEAWTTLYHMSSTEYLNYEGGKFSKSKGVGVFGTDARDTGIPADVWRFYMYYNRPEKSDARLHVEGLPGEGERRADRQPRQPRQPDPGSSCTVLRRGLPAGRARRAVLAGGAQAVEAEIGAHPGEGGAARGLPRGVRALFARKQEVPGRRAVEGGQGEPRGHGGPDLEPRVPRARPRHPRCAPTSRARRTGSPRMLGVDRLRWADLGRL